MKFDPEFLHNAAIDWKYLIVMLGGMATKSDLDQWLMARYGLSEVQAHDVANDVEFQNRRYFTIGDGRVSWNEYNAHRPAPTVEQYGGIDAITHNGALGHLYLSKTNCPLTNRE